MIDLGQGRHGGTPAGMADALLDGDCRREPGDGIHLGPFKDPHILPDIGRQAFQITPLTLCKKDVKDQGGFSGTGDACDDHKLVPGNREAEILEVVFSGPSYLNVAFGFCFS